MRNLSPLDRARLMINSLTDEIPDKFCDIFMTKRPTRKDIKDYVELLKSSPDDLGKDPFPLKHDLSDGFYRREVKVPAGTLMAGSIHTKESYVIMLKGKVMVVAEGGAKLLEGPCAFASPPGMQKVGFVFEEMIWLDIHATDAQTIEEAEAELFTESYEVLDRMDYARLLAERGMTEDQARQIVENEGDVQQLSLVGVEIRESKIEGLGVFALAGFTKDQTIECARRHDMRTQVGRYTNHSPDPNALAFTTEHGINFVARQRIAAGEEITVDYRQAYQCATELEQQRGRASCHQ